MDSVCVYSTLSHWNSLREQQQKDGGLWWAVEVDGSVVNRPDCD